MLVTVVTIVVTLMIVRRSLDLCSTLIEHYENTPMQYTPNKISNWSFFKLIFSDQALIILKRFLPIYVCFNRQIFSGVLINLSFNPHFFW